MDAPYPGAICIRYDVHGRPVYNRWLEHYAPVINFDEWLVQLKAELTRLFGDGEEYVRQTGLDCWKEMFDEGLSAKEAAHEEYHVACEDGGA